MNLQDLSKPTPLESIDWRVQSISAKGFATILGYKDARYDMNVLDSVLGPNNWKKEFAVIAGNLFCGVSLWCDEKNQWVTKWDVGTESNTEKEKGQASDAFKRACFNLGIGRDLYDLPRIQVFLKPNEFTKVKANNKEIGRATFDLQMPKWTWSRNEKGLLVGKDETGETRFIEGETWNKPRGDGGQSAPAPKKTTPPANSEHVGRDPVCSAEDVEEIVKLAKKAKVTGAQLKAKLESMKIGKAELEELNKAEAATIIGSLKAKIAKDRS